MAGRIRLYTGEHIRRAVVTGLRRRGVELLTSQRMGMLRAAQEGHLELGSREGQAIRTQEVDLHIPWLPGKTKLLTLAGDEVT